MEGARGGPPPLFLDQEARRGGALRDDTKNGCVAD